LSGQDALAYLDNARPEQVNLDCKHKVFIDITAKGILNAEVLVVFRMVQANDRDNESIDYKYS
jgi:hypothetical protein